MKKRPVKTRSQTGTVVFYVIYFVLLAAVLSAAVVGLGQLWQFLQHYEASQIYHVTDAIAAELNSGKLDLLYNASGADISPYENGELLKRQISERFTGEFSLKKNIKKSTKTAPVYTLMCGEDAVAFITLGQTGTDPLYGLEFYGAESITPIEPIRNERVKLTFPTGCTAELNGIALLPDTKYTSAPIAEAANFGDYLTDAPEMLTCTISGLMYPPTVTFRDSAGNEMAPDNSGNGAYSCGLPEAGGETAEDAARFALEFSELYSRYIANDAYFSSISGYIPPDTKLYHDLQTYEGQFYTYHTGYDFSEEKTLRITRYSESCYAVRVSYVHNVYYGETYSYPADNTVFAVNTADGWRAVGLTMN